MSKPLLTVVCADCVERGEAKPGILGVVEQRRGYRRWVGGGRPARRRLSSGGRYLTMPEFSSLDVPEDLPAECRTCEVQGHVSSLDVDGLRGRVELKLRAKA